MTRHPMALTPDPPPEHPMDAPGWRCPECGARPGAGGCWRWAGERWEHRHPGVGWVAAESEESP